MQQSSRTFCDYGKLFRIRSLDCLTNFVVAAIVVKSQQSAHDCVGPDGCNTHLTTFRRREGGGRSAAASVARPLRHGGGAAAARPRRTPPSKLAPRVPHLKIFGIFGSLGTFRTFRAFSGIFRRFRTFAVVYGCFRTFLVKCNAGRGRKFRKFVWGVQPNPIIGKKQ